MKKLSGLQQDVLALYRKLLRETAKKDRAQAMKTGATLSELLKNSETSTNYASQEFRRQATSVKRSDFKMIEFKIRQGEKKIKLLTLPGVTNVGGI